MAQGQGERLEGFKSSSASVIIRNKGRSTDALAPALATLNAEYEQYQREGRELDALACLRRACVLREETSGAKLRHTKQARENFIKCSNIVAVKLLRQGDGERSCKLLLSAYGFASRGGKSRARAATLANIASCMYGKEMLTESVHYLSLLQGSPFFRGERHLCLCASFFKLRKQQQALFHAESAVHFAQLEVAHCFRETALPACFRAEALMVLCLSYHAMGATLSAVAQRNIWSHDAEARRKGVMRALQGVRWLTRAYKEVAVAHAWAVPMGLRSAVWHSLLSSCHKCYPRISGALCRGEITGNLAVAVSVRNHVSASRIQRSMRKFMFRKESTAALLIQRGSRRYLQLRRQRQSTAAVQLQRHYRRASARSRIVVQRIREDSFSRDGDELKNNCHVLSNTCDELDNTCDDRTEPDQTARKKRLFWKSKTYAKKEGNQEKGEKKKKTKRKIKKGIFRTRIQKVAPEFPAAREAVSE